VITKTYDIGGQEDGPVAAAGDGLEEAGDFIEAQRPGANAFATPGRCPYNRPTRVPLGFC